MSLRQYEMTCLTKKRGTSGSAADCPRFLCVFGNCVCLPSPWSIYADRPTNISAGAVTSAFFISNYLHFIFRHNLSCYFYLTVIYLNYQLSLIYICLECNLMSEEKRVRRTPEQIAADLDVQLKN